MTAVEWEEVKRLAADFQKAQLQGTVQRLSDRNCVEIVNKLVECNLLDVIYTADGKEYLTHAELLREIKDELIVHGGRVNLADLTQILNVDYSHIEAKVTELLKIDPTLELILGQLISRNYVDRIAEEIDDKLQDTGQISIADLTKHYDLPGDFLMDNVSKRLGVSIKGKADTFDPRVIYTEAFLSRHRARIRGVLHACTRPTPVPAMIKAFGFNERLFFSLAEDMCKSGELAGNLTGGHSERALYMPDVYAKAQSQYVEHFYKQNGYLEYDTLVRIGITEPKLYIKKCLKNEPLVFLSSCCCGTSLQEQLEASVEEALSSQTWVDTMHVLPSIFTIQDTRQLLEKCLKQLKEQDALICCDSIVVSEKFIQTCSKYFEDLITAKAENEAKKLLFIPTEEGTTSVQTFEKPKAVTLDISQGGRQAKKEERRQKAAGSAAKGGGAQGRETKTKSLKKKGARGRGDNKDKDDSDDEMTMKKTNYKTSEFMSLHEIENVLSDQLQEEECPNEMITAIAEQLHASLESRFQERVKSVFMASASQDSQARRKTREELVEKINGLTSNIKLFEKGINKFGDDAHQQQLTKHLLKTVCNDIVNLLVIFLSLDAGKTVEADKPLTSEGRSALVTSLPTESKTLAKELINSLAEKTTENFHKCLDAMLEECQLPARKMERKKERQHVFSHRMALMEQLRDESDPAMMLHLSVVVLFLNYTQCILNASGKFVPMIIAYLKSYLSKEQHDDLVMCQELVVKQLNMERNEENDKNEVSAQLNVLLPRIKELALNVKKESSQHESEQ